NQWMLLELNVVACGIFVAKGALVVFVQMWLRWTLPRPRIDQVLYSCVKVMLPLACALLLGATLWGLFVPERAGVPWRDYHPFDWASLTAGEAGGFGTVVQVLLAAAGLAIAGGIVSWVAYAAVTGRRIAQRLTDPEPIETGAEELAKA